jgi:glutathione reductase (NADPH)
LLKVSWVSTYFIAIHDAAAYGFDIQDKPAFSWNIVKKKRDAYIERLNGIYGNNLGKDSIDIIQGTASFVDAKTVRVGDQVYSSKHILIATGSKAWIPNISGAVEHGVTR